jgi:hypothetical protein
MVGQPAERVPLTRMTSEAAPTVPGRGRTRPGRRWSLAAGVAVSSTGFIPLPAEAQDVLFAATADNLNPVPVIAVLDPSTGNFLSKVVTYQIGAGLTYDGGRLWTTRVGPPVGLHSTYRLHPADGTAVMVGPTGLVPPSYYWMIEVHPQTGVLYGVFFDSLYTVDKATGAATLIGQFTGLYGGTSDWIAAFAIDPWGNAYGTGVQAPRVYSLDLATATATLIGNLQMGFGEFYDLAFNGQGGLWGVFDSYTTYSPKNGLYRIDLSTMTSTQVSWSKWGFTGIAFGPACAAQSYCTGKPNSLGCVASIVSKGVSSPSALSGFEVSAASVRNQTLGILLYATTGAAAVPFQGGVLCVAPPVQRSKAVSSGGSAAPAVDCSGVLSLDFNSLLAGKYHQTDLREGPVPPPGFPPGTTVYCQWWIRDPGLPPPNSSALSDALQFVLCP